MKIPKLFLPEKGFDKKIEDLMSKEDKQPEQPEHEGFGEGLFLKIKGYLKSERARGSCFNPVLCIVDSSNEDRAASLDKLICGLAIHAKGWVAFLSIRDYKELALSDLVKKLEEAQLDSSRRAILYMGADTMNDLSKGHYLGMLSRMTIIYTGLD